VGGARSKSWEKEALLIRNREKERAGIQFCGNQGKGVKAMSARNFKQHREYKKRGFQKACGVCKKKRTFNDFAKGDKEVGGIKDKKHEAREVTRPK